MLLKSNDGYNNISVDNVSDFPYCNFNKYSSISSFVNTIDLLLPLKCSIISYNGKSLVPFFLIISLIGLSIIWCSTESSFSYKPVEEQYNNVFSETDAVTLLTYLQEINNEPYALAIQLFFYLFIRIGEMKAIRWSDIDFANRRVYLHNQAITDYELNDDLTFSAREVVVSDRMKGYTSKGYRYEHLTDQAIEILEVTQSVGNH
ncbi:MAG: tyrosine-type recombinase/integrase [Lachnospiraceae bacterium]|nr:tyrosine-type recombinase/integrase [Lachnospiraceae bacterium]